VLPEVLVILTDVKTGGRPPGSQKPGEVLHATSCRAPVAEKDSVGAATFSSSAATGSRKAESNNRMDGHEGNAAHRAATVAQARTGHGHSLGAAGRRVLACRPPGSGTGVRITDIYGERLTVDGIAVRPDAAQPTGVQFARH
jgi:hypothetical protein